MDRGGVDLAGEDQSTAQDRSGPEDVVFPEADDDGDLQDIMMWIEPSYQESENTVMPQSLDCAKWLYSVPVDTQQGRMLLVSQLKAGGFDPQVRYNSGCPKFLRGDRLNQLVNAAIEAPGKLDFINAALNIGCVSDELIERIRSDESLQMQLRMRSVYTKHLNVKLLPPDLHGKLLPARRDHCGDILELPSAEQMMILADTLDQDRLFDLMSVTSNISPELKKKILVQLSKTEDEKVLGKTMEEWISRPLELLRRMLFFAVDGDRGVSYTDMPSNVEQLCKAVSNSLVAVVNAIPESETIYPTLKKIGTQVPINYFGHVAVLPAMRNLYRAIGPADDYVSLLVDLLYVLLKYSVDEDIWVHSLPVAIELLDDRELAGFLIPATLKPLMKMISAFKPSRHGYTDRKKALLKDFLEKYSLMFGEDYGTTSNSQ